MYSRKTTKITSIPGDRGVRQVGIKNVCFFFGFGILKYLNRRSDCELKKSAGVRSSGVCDKINVAVSSV